MPLTGGSLAYAVGFSVNKEALQDTPDFNQINDNVFGGIRQAAVNASRTSSGVFGELSIPFHKNVEAQVAARYDNISNVGNKTSPKVAIRYQPLPSLMLRASYAESFLAPTLKQMFGGQEAGAQTTEDKKLCSAFPIISDACDPFSYSRVSGSNLNLKPETGKTFNFGVVIEPISAVSIGVDYFRINKKNEIGKPSVFQALKNGHFGVVNGEAQIYMTNQNMASTDVEGFDIDLRYKTGSTPLGKITVRNTTTWYTKTNSQEIAGEEMGKYLGTFANPKYRNVITASLDNDEWNATASVRTVGGMIDFASSLDNIPPGTRFIPAHSELDVMGQYTGLKNLTFTGGVKNLMGKMPPYSDMGTLGQYGSGGFAQLYSPRGRYLYVGLNYKFY
ncbi:TonB-dependent receptor domain-containing protein [Solimicrobium silvestre]|uniref:TonB dependent receptor n=1 Tax=Solimicrobium silvestre TaxID=2099400 RepID=A0A2S9H2Z9_9BURK|nr:TonB-dependent receptor [Solimicrobium silvestre]PRC94340.1 TonB dependent receptor [Solimicrobium silvestre]